MNDQGRAVKRSTKAVLWSALVFPGAGHIYLKRYLRGALLVAASAQLVYSIVSGILTIAYHIAGQVQSGAVPPTVDAITKLVSQQSIGTQQSLNIASMVLLVLWVIGMADAYWCGRSRQETNPVAREEQA